MNVIVETAAMDEVPPVPPRRLARGWLRPGLNWWLRMGVGVLGPMLFFTTCRGDDLFRPLDKADIQIVLSGDTLGVADSSRLDVEVLVDGVPRADLPLSWVITDPTVARVDGAGLLRGLRRGQAQVTARLAANAIVDDSVSRAAPLWIVASGLLIDADAGTFTSLGDTLCVPYTVTDARGDSIPGVMPNFNITSDPDSTVRLRPNGCVVSLRTGRDAVLRVSLDTTQVDAPLRVRQTVSEMTVGPPDVTLDRIGDTARMTVDARDGNGNPVLAPMLGWRTDDPTVATVDSTGLVTAVDLGTTVIRITGDTTVDSARVTVDPPRLRVSPSTLSATAAVGSTAEPQFPIAVDNVGTGSTDWIVTTNVGWLTVSPTTGTDLDTVTVTFSPAGLSAGDHVGAVIVDAPGAADSPDTIPVTFSITGCDEVAVPPDTTIVGSFGGDDCSEAGAGPKQVFVSSMPSGDTLTVVGEANISIALDVLDSGGGLLGSGAQCPGLPAGVLCVSDVTIPADGVARIEVGAIGSGAGGAFTIHVVRPGVPDTPTDLTQRKSDSVTTVPTGSAHDETDLLFVGVVSDADPGEQVRLDVEIQPVGTAFTDTPTVTSSLTDTGDTATVAVSGLADDTDYHWQVRAVDQTGRATPWTSFGANGESEADVRIAIPEPPNPPASLAQLRSDSTTIIAIGSTTDETTVILRATVSDPDPGDSVRLQVEHRPIGTAFTGTATAADGVAVAGGTAYVATPIVGDTDYHWRLRTVDRTGRASAWVSFGGNAESEIDFHAVTPDAPNIPTGLSQFQRDSSTAIGIGEVTTESAVVMQATITDSDLGDQVSLQLEIQPVGTAFTDTPTVSSGLLPSGSSPFLLASGLTENTDYHWQVRTVDQGGRASAWVSFGGNAETARDVRVDAPEDPTPPTVLSQRTVDSTTILGVGATYTNAEAVFTALVTDPDVMDSLRLQVEVRPLGTAFTGVPTAVAGGMVTPSDTSFVSVIALADDVSYHWQARTIDHTGRTSGWISFGANTEGEPDFAIAVPQAPTAPGTLTQLRSDSTTTLTVGATTDESFLVVRATVSDPDPDDLLRLQVEHRPLGTPFTGNPTAPDGAPVASGTAYVSVPVVDDSDYHWQLRAIDQTGRTSPWVSFGANAETDADVRIFIPDPPDTPAGLAQFTSDSSTALDVGDITTESEVVLQATITDQDAGDQVSLEIEIQPVGTAFTGAATVSSGLVGSGSAPFLRVTGLVEGTDYHWQARAVDQTARASAWVSFGGNAENARDVRVDLPEDPSVPTVLSQRADDSTTVLPTGTVHPTPALVFAAVVTDPDADDSLRLEVEVQPLGTGFANVPTGVAGDRVGVGDTSYISLPGLSDDLAYHWQTRTIDQTGRTSGWVSFGGNVETDSDFAIAVPEAPNTPSGLSQLEADSTTVIAIGDTTTSSTVLFRATVTDDDPGDQLRLQVERQPLGDAFTGTPTATSPGTVASGSAASIAVTGQADDQAYHWQVRVIDQLNSPSAWVSFGGNAETDVDYAIAVPEDPDAPASLGQYRADSVTAIPVGGNSDGATVVLRGTVTDPDPGDSLSLQVEVQTVGTAFTNVATVSSPDQVVSGQVATVTFPVAVTTQYHWQARACDDGGRCSAWASFGANPETNADFVGSFNQSPDDPTALGQFRSDSLTVIAVGDTTDEATVVFRGTVTDPDAGAALRLEVEIQPLGTSFVGTATATSAAAVPSGAVASVDAPVADATSYHWQARTVDQGGAPSAWVSFGGNAETEADFTVDLPTPPDVPTASQQFLADSTTIVAVGGTVNDSIVVLRASLTDPDTGDSLYLEVEHQPVGTPFIGTPTATATDPVASGNPGYVRVTGLLEDTSYHWQARARDLVGNTGPWVSFGGNAETDPDFAVAIAEPPTAPASPSSSRPIRSRSCRSARASTSRRW